MHHHLLNDLGGSVPFSLKPPLSDMEQGVHLHLRGGSRVVGLSVELGCHVGERQAKANQEFVV